MWSDSVPIVLHIFTNWQNERYVKLSVYVWSVTMDVQTSLPTFY